MALGGMGDVHTGCLAALAAQGLRHHLSLHEATCLAVQVHALAADRLMARGCRARGADAYRSSDGIAPANKRFWVIATQSLGGHCEAAGRGNPQRLKRRWITNAGLLHRCNLVRQSCAQQRAWYCGAA